MVPNIYKYRVVGKEHISKYNLKTTHYFNYTIEIISELYNIDKILGGRFTSKFNIKCTTSNIKVSPWLSNLHAQNIKLDPSMDSINYPSHSIFMKQSSGLKNYSEYKCDTRLSSTFYDLDTIIKPSFGLNASNNI